MSQTFSLKPCELMLLMLNPCVGNQTPASPRDLPRVVLPRLVRSSPYLGGGDGGDLLGRQAFQQRGLARVVQPQQDDAELLPRGALQALDDGEQPLGARGAGGALRGAGSLQSTLVSVGGSGCSVGHFPRVYSPSELQDLVPRCPSLGLPHLR